ncbi:hypothetical protein AX17_003028 [Amanita inopinata Kibby_2008]|nr:hypothetical protein AX17_003028 [Amanita inopinata Kibby_2008]
MSNCVQVPSTTYELHPAPPGDRMSPGRLVHDQHAPLWSIPCEMTERKPQLRDMAVDGPTAVDTEDRPGFPTYAQYKSIENAYIDSLSPKRQSKALISQALFDRIWDVLLNPQRCGENSQFKYWVRKMFTLQPSAEMNANLGFDSNEPPPVVLLHDNLLVAVQEHIYGLLCFCHGQVNHAGRDRTCALLRQHYTWVPKELVSQFIKACPGCKTRRRGRVYVHAAAGLTKSEEALSGPSPPIPVTPCSSPSSAEIGGTLYTAEPWYFGHPSGFPLSELTMSLQSWLNTQQAPVNVSQHGQNAPAPNVPAGLGLHSLPMSREVSLYQGLPNGWQYYSDYASAYAACIELKNQQAESPACFRRRPRIPSIAPMVPPNIQELFSGRFPSYLDQGGSQHSSMSSSATLRGHMTESRQQYPDCIDPALLQLSYPEAEESFGSTMEIRSCGRDCDTCAQSAGSGVTPRLNLGSTNDNNEQFQAMYVYREPQQIAGSPVLLAASPRSPNSLTPELVESNMCVAGDSPLATALSTPQDESIGGLAAGLEMMDTDGGFKCSPIQESSVHKVGGSGLSSFTTAYL